MNTFVGRAGPSGIDRSGPVQPFRLIREGNSMRLEPIGPTIEAVNPWGEPIGAGKNVMLTRAKARVDGRRKRRTVYAIAGAEL